MISAKWKEPQDTKLHYTLKQLKISLLISSCLFEINHDLIHIFECTCICIEMTHSAAIKFDKNKLLLYLLP